MKIKKIETKDRQRIKMGIVHVASNELECTERCTECQEPISNPLCYVCLSGEIISFFEQSKSKNKIVKELIKETKSIEKVNENRKGVACVVCRQPRCFFCPRCLTKHIYELLSEMKADKRTISEFHSSFSYFH